MATREDTGKLSLIGTRLYERVGPRGTSYYADVVEIDAGRKRQRRVKLDARNKTEARKAQERLNVKLDEATSPGLGDRRLTLEQLAERYLAYESGPQGRLSPRSIENVRQRLEAHALRVLGRRTKAASVKTPAIRSMVGKLKAEGKSGATIHAVVSAVSGMYRYGVGTAEILPTNPVEGLQRGELPSAKRKSEPRYLSQDEVKRLLSKLSDESRPIGAACYYAALRISEALALRWRNVDFEAKLIRVEGTKTEASRASVPLLPELARELQAHRERQGALGFARISQDALVFQTSSGKPVHRRNVLRAVSSAAARAGLVPEGAQPVGVHDLRHSFAAFALGGGLSLTKTSRVLRHANPQVTATVYAGLTDEALQQLGDELTAIGDSQKT